MKLTIASFTAICADAAIFCIAMTVLGMLLSIHLDTRFALCDKWDRVIRYIGNFITLFLLLFVMFSALSICSLMLGLYVGFY